VNGWRNFGRLGQFIVLEAVQITALRRAGIVHDIGKVAVPTTSC